MMTVRKMYYDNNNNNDRSKTARCDVQVIRMGDDGIVCPEMRTSLLDPPTTSALCSKHSIYEISDTEDHRDPSGSATSSEIDEQDETSEHVLLNEMIPPPASPHRVSFGNDEIIEVQSYKYDTSLWWSKMDMISRRKEDRKSCLTDQRAKNYLYYFESFYRNMDDNCDGKSLSALDCKILANGLRIGYQGVERESFFEQIRQKERQEIVRAIVAAHGSLSFNGDDHVDETLSTFSSYLTRKMSNWSACVGEAAHLAAQDKLEP
jgi:hypothetical protein